ncbi:xanthine dehydrogenase accessory protein XdhC [Pseudoruegeria sp. SK021]|uniref:xanthine dehydrogenase accessory protein XdhC n=1 Tax=Pseudoruegeria sp. SK021 TaxID=1933035 RepID=UPI000A22EFDD|nr:xanthine dehydrogenase accessory protein XdhC [Pseudoruegeria sp. SK021]OSP56041.1 xanthine dehydrogenase accessory protein XdhC [Pseudoruegeria sp. SK021]
MSFDLEALQRAVAAHGRVARVLVAEVRGSSPREVGAAMLVWAGGQSGTIGGGALEHQAALAALGTQADRVSRHPLGPSLGQCCGGTVTLITEVYDPARIAALTDALPPETPILRRIEGNAETPLALRRALRQARQEGIAPPPHFSHGWMIEPVAHPDRPLWIWGAGHVGRAMIDVMAPLPGLALTWIDTGPERFPDTVPNGVTVLPAADPVALVRHAPPDADHLILTYSHALDLDLCHALLAHGFGRTGLIGSTSKWARFQSRLRSLGHVQTSIDRINCPIGDPSLGKTPHAIAISTAAALLRPASAAAAPAKETRA